MLGITYVRILRNLRSKVIKQKLMKFFLLHILIKQTPKKLRFCKYFIIYYYNTLSVKYHHNSQIISMICCITM